MALKDASSDTISVTVLLMGSASGIYAMLCPSLFTSGSSFFHDNGDKDHNVRNMRLGYAAATGITLIMGIAASKVEHSALPLIGAAVVGGVAIAGYEWAMAHPPKGKVAKDASRPVFGAIGEGIFLA